MKQQHTDEKDYNMVYQILADHTFDGVVVNAPPMLRTRALKASQILQGGKVHIENWTLGKEVATVNGTNQTYRVRRTDDFPKQWTCSCRDFATRKGFNSPVYGNVCKHILAVIIRLRGDKPIQEKSASSQPTATQAYRVDEDPFVYKAVKDGETFEYLFAKAIELYAPQLLNRAKSKGICTPSDLKSCTRASFTNIFEISELDEWGEFWNVFENGILESDFMSLKVRLIEEFREQSNGGNSL